MQCWLNTQQASHNHITNKARSSSGSLMTNQISTSVRQSDIAIFAKSSQRQAVAPNKGQLTRADTRKLRAFYPRVWQLNFLLISQFVHIFRLLCWQLPLQSVSSVPCLWAGQDNTRHILLLPLSKRNHLQPGLLHLWLVVQCQLWVILVSVLTDPSSNSSLAPKLGESEAEGGGGRDADQTGHHLQRHQGSECQVRVPARGWSDNSLCGCSLNREVCEVNKENSCS